MANARRARRALGLGLSLVLLLGVTGCIDPVYLAKAKDQYETRHRLKKAEPTAAQDGASQKDEKKVHPPYADRACAKCHDQQQGSALLAQDDALCWLCHKADEFKRERLHGPVAVGKCSDCHLSHESPYPNHTTDALPQLCLACHPFAWSNKTGFAEGFLVHEPVRTGGCPKCHDPHGGSRRLFLKQEVRDLCLTCHDAAKYGQGVVHGPLAVGDCLACHDPHAARVPRLLKAEPSADLCARCHTQPRPKCGAKPGVRDCLPCHNPHQLSPGTGSHGGKP